MTDASLDYTPIQVQLMRPLLSGREEIAVIAAEEPALHVYRMEDNADLVQRATVQLLHPPRMLTSADMNGDGVPEHVTLSRDGKFVSIIDRTKRPLRERIINVVAQRHELVIADINNDKRPDLLFFGRNVPGVVTFLGTAGGDLQLGPSLFPEISISGLVTTDLNGDGITDILLLNWLSNQLAVFYGIGRGIFAEQVSMDLPGEPAEIAITPVTRERTVRVAVAMPEKQLISILNGNGAGEFELSDTINCEDPPSEVQFALVNADPHVDLLSSTRKGIIVMHGLSAGTFGPPTVFGVCDAPVSWALGDIDGDRKLDLVIADSSGKRIVLLGNASPSGSVVWPPQYCVGNSPRGLATGDLNGDGLVDIALVNAGSSSLSVLFNKGGGRMDGQQALQISEQPVFVKTAISPLPSQRTIVTSHSSVDMLTVVRLSDTMNHSPSFTIPTGSNPYVLLATEDSATGDLELLVRYSNPQDGSRSLSLFEQIGKGQFLERSIRSDAPKTISGLTVGVLGGKGEYELVFVSNDRTSKKSTISVALSASNFTFASSTPLFSYADSTASTQSVLPGYVDADSFKDFVLLVGPPRNAIGVVYGRGQATFRDSVEWIPEVQPLNDDAIVFRDVDNDGHGDMTLIDSVRKEIVVLYGMIDGQFGPPVRIHSARGVMAIGVAPLREPKVQDLVFTNSDKGIVAILFHPFRR